MENRTAIPLWRSALAPIFRFFGAIVIAAPFVVFAYDTEDHNINAILMDLPGILVVLLCCIGLGVLLYFFGNRIATKNRSSEAAG